MTGPRAPIHICLGLLETGVAQRIQYVPAKILKAQRAFVGYGITVEFRWEDVVDGTLRVNRSTDAGLCMVIEKRYCENQ